MTVSTVQTVEGTVHRSSLCDHHQLLYGYEKLRPELESWSRHGLFATLCYFFLSFSFHFYTNLLFVQMTHM